MTLAADATLQGRPFEFQSNGSFDYAGTVTNTLHAMPGSTMTIEGGAVLAGGMLHNEGYVTQAQDGTFGTPGALIENSGTHELVGAASIQGDGSSQAVIYNGTEGSGDPSSGASG